jgi:hypothetical protein
VFWSGPSSAVIGIGCTNIARDFTSGIGIVVIAAPKLLAAFKIRGALSWIHLI